MAAYALTVVPHRTVHDRHELNRLRLLLFPRPLRDRRHAGGLGGPGTFWANALSHGLFAVFCLLAAVFAGAVLTPFLLPWLPGRAFSLKGLTMGLVTAVILSLLRWDDLAAWHGRFEMMGWVFLVPAIAAYLAMNFTGASTFTSLSGVKKEMRWAVPMQISAAVVGLGLWIGSGFVA